MNVGPGGTYGGGAETQLNLGAHPAVLPLLRLLQFHAGLTPGLHPVPPVGQPGAGLTLRPPLGAVAPPQPPLGAGQQGLGGFIPPHPPAGLILRHLLGAG